MVSVPGQRRVRLMCISQSRLHGAHLFYHCYFPSFYDDFVRQFTNKCALSRLPCSTALAVAGKDFVVIASDTRISTGYSIHTRDGSKIHQLYVGSFILCPFHSLWHTSDAIPRVSAGVFARVHHFGAANPNSIAPYIVLKWNCDHFALIVPARRCSNFFLGRDRGSVALASSCSRSRWIKLTHALTNIGRTSQLSHLLACKPISRHFSRSSASA